jgi:hypothetical protein
VVYLNVKIDKFSIVVLIFDYTMVTVVFIYRTCSKGRSCACNRFAVSIPLICDLAHIICGHCDVQIHRFSGVDINGFLGIIFTLDISFQMVNINVKIYRLVISVLIRDTASVSLPGCRRIYGTGSPGGITNRVTIPVSPLVSDLTHIICGYINIEIDGLTRSDINVSMIAVFTCDKSFQMVYLYVKIDIGRVSVLVADLALILLVRADRINGEGRAGGITNRITIRVSPLVGNLAQIICGYINVEINRLAGFETDGL